MSDYKYFYDHIDEAIKNAMRPTYELQKRIYDSLAPTRAIQNSISEIMRPYRELTNIYARILSRPIEKFTQDISKEMAGSFVAPLDAFRINPELSKAIRHMASSYPVLAGTPGGHTYDFPDNLGGVPVDDDFVIVDESAIEEYEIPDSLAAPIGNKKVRIKTDFFITLLVTIILWFASVAIDEYHRAEDSQSQLAAEKRQTELQQMEIDILNKILQSVDSSSSAEDEAIQSLREDVQAHGSAISALRESDQAQNKHIEDLQSSSHTDQCSCDTESEPVNTDSKQ